MAEPERPDPKRVRELFGQAMSIAASERHAYLVEASGGDEALRLEVEALLEMAMKAGEGFLDRPLAPDAVATAALAPVLRTPELTGTTIDHFEVKERIGSGGMGVVYRAIDTRLRRTVALKFIGGDMAADPSAHERFMREARVAAALDHPNIGAIHDLCEWQGRSYIVMSHYEGSTLAQKIERGPIPIAEVWSFLGQLAAALEAAHGAGIVHRDLKPANVLVMPSGQVKVLDFGLAKLLGPTDESGESLSSAGVVMGTVAYMSPEQAHGSALDHRTDLWSLGAIAYEMLTGVSPFRAESTAATLTRILMVDPRPVGSLRKDAPDVLVHATEELLRKNRDERIGSASALIAMLARGVDADLPATAALRLPASGRSRRIRSRVGLALLGMVVAVVGAVGVLWRSPEKAPRRVESLAVLPLDDLGNDPEQAYFADGLTDEIITRLGQIKSLRVVPRTSVMKYKQTRMTLREIGNELRVDALVEGTVAHAGSRVRIAATLIAPATDERIWGNTYERDLVDVLALQSNVASDIAGAIEVKLTPEERTRLAVSKPVDPGAYDAYLRGLYQKSQLTPEGFVEALGLFQESIAIDATYAPAYVGMADVYSEQAFWGITDSKDAFSNATALALKALELDPDLGSAHTTLAQVHVAYEWDFSRAEREFRRAIELNPSDVFAHHKLSNLLAALGRADESVAMATRAEFLRPSHPGLHLAWILYLTRRYNAAIELYKKWLDPEVLLSQQTYETYGDALLAAGREEEAFDAYLEYARLVDTPDEVVTELAQAYASQCFEGYWRKRLQLDTLEWEDTGNVWPYRMAKYHARLGDVGSAMVWLEFCFAERAERLYFLGVDPAFDAIRDDLAVQSIIRRIGLPPALPARSES